MISFTGFTESDFPISCRSCYLRAPLLSVPCFTFSPTRITSASHPRLPFPFYCLAFSPIGLLAILTATRPVCSAAPRFPPQPAGASPLPVLATSSSLRRRLRLATSSSLRRRLRLLRTFRAAAYFGGGWRRASFPPSWYASAAGLGWGGGGRTGEVIGGATGGTVGRREGVLTSLQVPLHSS